MGPDKPLFEGFLTGTVVMSFLTPTADAKSWESRREVKVEWIGLRLGHVGPGHRQAACVAVGGRLAVGLDVGIGLDVGPVLAEREAVSARR